MWYDSRLREGLADIVGTPIPDLAWLISSLPPSIGGLGLTSAFATRSAAHYASWASSWHSISRMFPSAIPLAAADLATSPLPFAHGIRTAHAAVDSALTAVTDNINQHPLPHFVPKNPSIPGPVELGKRFPRVQSRIAAIVHSARWIHGFSLASTPHRALMLSQASQGSMFAFTAVPNAHSTLTPTSFITGLQLRLRLPLSILYGLTTC